MLKNILISGVTTLCVIQLALCQQWTKTPIKDLATIAFPVPVTFKDTMGISLIWGHTDTASYIVTIHKIPIDGAVNDIELLKHGADGHLDAQRAQSTKQSEFTVNGYKGLENWYITPPEILGARTDRCIRIVYIKGYAIVCEFGTFSEYATNKSVQQSMTQFFSSFQPLSTYDPAQEVTASESRSWSGYSTGELVYKVTYLLGRILCIGIIILIIVTLFRRLI